MLAEVEDRGRQTGAGPGRGEAIVQMFQGADPAGGDHRHRNRVNDRPGQRQVITVLGPIPVHAGQQNFTGAKLFNLARPGQGIQAGEPGTARDHHFKAA